MVPKLALCLNICIQVRWRVEIANGGTGNAFHSQTRHVLSRYLDTNSEMLQFTSGLRSGFCETRSNFYHTLQGAYEDTVPGPEDFRHHMIFHRFLWLDLACHQGTFAPQLWGSSFFGCTRPMHAAKTSYMILQTTSGHHFRWPSCRSAIPRIETLRMQ